MAQTPSECYKPRNDWYYPPGEVHTSETESNWSLDFFVAPTNPQSHNKQKVVTHLDDFACETQIALLDANFHP